MVKQWYVEYASPVIPHQKQHRDATTRMMESEAETEALVLACIILLDNKRVSIRMVNNTTRNHFAVVLFSTFGQDHIHGVDHVLQARADGLFCLVKWTHVSTLTKRKIRYIFQVYSRYCMLGR